MNPQFDRESSGEGNDNPAFEDRRAGCISGRFDTNMVYMEFTRPKVHVVRGISRLPSDCYFWFSYVGFARFTLPDQYCRRLSCMDWSPDLLLHVHRILCVLEEGLHVCLVEHLLLIQTWRLSRLCLSLARCCCCLRWMFEHRQTSTDSCPRILLRLLQPTHAETSPGSLLRTKFVKLFSRQWIDTVVSTPTHAKPNVAAVNCRTISDVVSHLSHL